MKENLKNENENTINIIFKKGVKIKYKLEKIINHYSVH